MVDDITTPTLLVDRARCVRSIQTMADKAARHDLVLRPHFKTHQSHAMGRLFRERGVRAITVSSISMARYFADDGWTDITVAFPVNLREIRAINELNARITLNLLVESEESVAFLDSHLEAPGRVFIAVDSGYRRTGIVAEDLDALRRVFVAVRGARRLEPAGVLTHAGHTYHARGADEILSVHRESLARLAPVRKVAAEYAIPSDGSIPIVSIGDTPSCSVAEEFPGVDEIRPGNFVFYDLSQVEIGSCTIEDIALAVACPVVALHPDRNQVVLYGGAVHLSKQSLPVDDPVHGASTIYGRVVPLRPDGWGDPIPGARVTSVSQEHGIVTVEDASTLGQFRLGDLVGILPVHSCLAVNLLRDIRFI